MVIIVWTAHFTSSVAKGEENEDNNKSGTELIKAGFSFFSKWAKAYLNL